MEQTMLFGLKGPIGATEATSGPVPTGGAPDDASERGAGATEKLDLTRYERSQPAGAGSAFAHPTGPSTVEGQRLAATAPDLQQGAQLLVPAVPRGVPFSRQLVRELCRLLDLDAVADLAELLASEVVTNAVLHASTVSLRILVEARQGELMVSVADDDSHLPTMRQPTVDSLGGRGLHLLDRLADSWGVTEWPDGKAVWFTLSTHSPPKD